ncbi:MAG: hypothetical protein AAF799_45320 [Myxococcota bacterium]
MHADSLPISGPCPIDLDTIGFDREAKVSHCTHCSKNVTNVSNMTRDEARSFMGANRGKKMCISYARDEQGRIRFQPEPEPEVTLVPVSRLRARPKRRAGLAAAAMSVALAACTPHGEGEPGIGEVEVIHRDDVVEVGKMEMPEVTPDQVQPKPPIDVPEPMPLAGAAVIPDDLIEGEIEIPGPEVIDADQPCDGNEPAPKAKRGMQKL